MMVTGKVHDAELPARSVAVTVTTELPNRNTELPETAVLTSATNLPAHTSVLAQLRTERSTKPATDEKVLSIIREK